MKSLLTSFCFFLVLHADAQDTTKDNTFTKVMIEATYPGGTAAWNRFLGKNLHYPDDAVNNEIQGTVVIQFLIDTAGKISDFKAVSGPTKGRLREEAIRVVSISGEWVPAVQNGIKVRCYHKVPIMFKMVVN